MSDKNDGKIKIDDGGATEVLESIRIKLGLQKEPVDLRPEREGRTINTFLEFEEIIHEFDILTDDGVPVFAYIPDHTIGDYTAHTSPYSLRKVHFTFCTTLRGMKKKGRFESRYRVTKRDDNKYRIVLGNGKEDRVKLHPCKHCLELSGYRSYTRKSRKREIVENFDAKEAMKLIWQIFNIFKRDVENLRSEFASVGYPSNWPKISFRFRKKRNFTCELCGVNLSTPLLFRRLTDAHHIDGDKSNCEDDNLQCLCKECHSHLHAHYEINDKELEIIRAERREQGLSNPNY